jgi:L-aspartate oxidase
MAYRAGALVADLEFVQFHPTVLQHPREEGSFLLSEALRGEGAVLRNCHGERFMPAYHEMADLGPRDVVSRAIVDQMTLHNSPMFF